MRNHDQKYRDMTRSILPSKARHSARERKKASARRARARNKARLDRIIGYLDDLEDFEEDLGRYDLDDCGWDGMVEDRRGADKIAPLVRWAEIRIRRTPRLANGDYGARASYFSRLLGDNVVGRHAHGHLERLFGEQDPFRYGRRQYDVTVVRAQRRAEAAAELADRERKLGEVLTAAGPRRLNARIVALTPPVEEHFAFDVERGRYHCGTAGYCPRLYCGDPAAWLGADGRDVAAAIAFEALDEVHAELFGYDP